MPAVGLELGGGREAWGSHGAGAGQTREELVVGVGGDPLVERADRGQRGAELSGVGLDGE